MREGALRQEACSADIAVSNTGVADSPPEDGPEPGTQCFAWSYRQRSGEIVTFSETKVFEGARNKVRRAAAQYAISRIEHYFDRLSER